MHTGHMVVQPAQKFDARAGLCLLVAIAGSVVAAVGAAVSAAGLLFAGIAVIVTGASGVGVFIYRSSRASGTGVVKSFGRAANFAVRMILEMVS